MSSIVSPATSLVSPATSIVSPAPSIVSPVSAIVVPVSLDPSNKSSNVTLSNANLTATNGNTSNYNNVFATRAPGPDAAYFEGTVVTNSVPGGFIVGLAPATFSTTADFIGDTGTVGFITNGPVFVNGSQLLNFGTSVTATHVICVAYRKSINKVWFRIDGGLWNNDVIGNQNPATNTGGLSTTGLTGLVAAWTSETATDTITFNFGATAFAQSPPSGYSSY